MAALAYPAAVAIGEAIMWTAAAIGAVVTGAVVADQVSKANEKAKAKARLRDEVADKPCKDCGPKNPCAALAGGGPGKYKGGAHAFMKTPTGDGLDSHHMPAKAISPLPPDMGPAIKMDPEDHKLTASYGKSAKAFMYRNAQKKLISSGNFAAAFAMDVADIKSKNPNGKYDNAIVQATAYMACLKKFGLVK